MDQNAKSKKPMGLTFLEMLISVAIFALVATAISVIFQRSLVVYRATVDKNEAGQQARIAADWLVRDIQSATDIKATTDLDEITMVVAGNDIHYYMAANTIQRAEGVTPSLLAENVVGLNFQYYDINNTLIGDPVGNKANLRIIEIDIRTQRNNQNFRLNTVAKFDFTPVPAPTTTGLPKTGQETSYANYDDAYYANPAGGYDIGYTRGEGTWAGWNAVDGTGRFTNNGDGTITDNATGLMWVANPTAAGVGGFYTWANAITACENLTYPTGGYTDWRLPNIKELMSIVDYGTYNPPIDPNFFTCQSSYYWSSTTDVYYTIMAWQVYFYDGSISSSFKSSGLYYVRPVRGGQEGGTAGLPKTGLETSYTNYDDAYYANPAGPDIGYTRGEGTWAGWNAVDGTGRFTNNGDGTITDNATGLMWVANPTAAGVGGTYTWANAITACENLTYPTGGYTDWRLPNIKELMSIVDYGTYYPAIDPNFFTSQSGLYWSSTTDAYYTTYAWYVYFYDGSVGGITKTSPLYVYPVRGGQ